MSDKCAYKTMEEIGAAVKKVNKLIEDAKENDPELYDEIAEIIKSANLPNLL